MIFTVIPGGWKRKVVIYISNNAKKIICLDLKKRNFAISSFLNAWQPNVHENDFWCLPRGGACMPSYMVGDGPL